MAGRLDHLTATQRDALAELVRDHPTATRDRIATEFRRRTGRRITAKTVTDARARGRDGYQIAPLPEPAEAAPC